jgi:hypothetical protein
MGKEISVTAGSETIMIIHKHRDILHSEVRPLSSDIGRFLCLMVLLIA